MQNDGNQKHPSRRAASGKGSREQGSPIQQRSWSLQRNKVSNGQPPGLKHEHLSKRKWNRVVIGGETAWSLAGREIVNSGPLFAQFSDLLLGGDDTAATEAQRSKK